MARISLVDRLHWREKPLAALAVVAIAAAAFVASLVVAPGVPGWLGGGLALIVIAIAVIDARFFIIPNELSLAALMLALANAAVRAPDFMWSAIGFALLRGVVLGLLFYALAALYRMVRGREGLGLGDVKLAVVAGAWLDWMSAPIAIEIAALAAISVFAVQYFAGRQTLDTTAKLPFGLFLAPSIWLAWLVEVTLLAPPGL